MSVLFGSKITTLRAQTHKMKNGFEKISFSSSNTNLSVIKSFLETIVSNDKQLRQELDEAFEIWCYS